MGKKLKKEKTAMSIERDILKLAREISALKPPRGKELDDLENEIERGIGKAKKLSGVDPKLAKFLVDSGLDDGDPSDDKIAVSKTSMSAAKLKPSQTTIKLWGVLGIALQMLRKGKVGGNLGALISKDNHILDGHHRWAAAIVAGGSSTKVGGYKASLPGKDLIKVLNIVTKGEFGRNQGNAGTGNISDVNPSKVKEFMEGYIEKGIKGDFPVSAKSVRDTLEKAFGSIEKGIETMSANAGKVSKSVPGWAPSRSDMPVIDPEETPGAASLLTKGQVNWKRPFVDPKSDKMPKISSVAEGMLDLARVLGREANIKNDFLEYQYNFPNKNVQHEAMRITTMNLNKLKARIRKMTNRKKLMHLSYILSAIGRNVMFRKYFEGGDGKYVVDNRDELYEMVEAKLKGL